MKVKLWGPLPDVVAVKKVNELLKVLSKSCSLPDLPINDDVLRLWVLNRLGVGSEILDGDLDVFRRSRKTAETWGFNV